MKLGIRNAGMSQETVDDFKEMDRRLYQMLISFTKGESRITFATLKDQG